MQRGAFSTGLSTALAAALFFAAAPSSAMNITGEGPDIGEEACDFTLPDTRGQNVTLSEFRGKVILLSFWSCYTDKCFTSVRVLRDLLDEFHGQGLVAPTVCAEIPEALARNEYEGLLKRCGLGQVILVDSEQEAKCRYKVRRLPSSYLIGRDFTLREIVKGVGRLSEPDFREKIINLLEEVAPTAPGGGE